MEVNRLLKQYDAMLQLFKQMNGPRRPQDEAHGQARRLPPASAAWAAVFPGLGM